MNKFTMEAYAEVDNILNLMESQYIAQIPEKLREFFKEKKDKNYDKKIVRRKPLKEQHLNKEALSILAVLNYKYWCKDENRKKELIEIYAENERKYQEKLREKYNPDDIFKSKTLESINSENQSILEIKSEIGIFKRIKNWIMKLFK